MLSYKQAEGQPQFWAQFSDRNLAPDVPDSLFVFTIAVGVDNAMASASLFATPDKEAHYYRDNQWKIACIGGSHEFIRNGVRLLDGRTLFHNHAGGITSAMSSKMVGAGSQYAYAERDLQGNYRNGSEASKFRSPRNVPAKNLWSFVLYDPDGSVVGKEPKSTI